MVRLLFFLRAENISYNERSDIYVKYKNIT